jgi:hypothetical protein
MSSNLIIWDSGAVSNPWAENLAYPIQNVNVCLTASILSVFDARVMNRAIRQSGGEATDSANLGTVHYTYDDMENNDGKVTLPYG